MGLSIPKWLDNELYDKCIKYVNNAFLVAYGNNFLTKFRGSPLAITLKDNMITRAKLFLENQSGIKMVGYFAHDTTLVALLAHIGSYNQIQPPFASSLILETYYDMNMPVIDNNSMSQFFVRLLFKNDTTLSPYVLNIGICKDENSPVQTFCRLDIFHNRLQNLAFKNLDHECKLNRD